MTFTGCTTKCTACEKTVYPMEMITADGNPYHRPCFKCAQCSSVLKLGNYASLDGKTYCKPHFKQLFQLKGNYSMGDESSSSVPRTADYRLASSLVAPSQPSTAPKTSPQPKSPPPKPDFRAGEKVEEEPVGGMSVAERMKLLNGNLGAVAGGGGEPRPKPSGRRPVFGGTQEKCLACKKTVYALEKVTLEGGCCHRECFKCSQCHTGLTMGTYSALEGVILCKQHYLENFKVKSGRGAGADGGAGKENSTGAANQPTAAASPVAAKAAAPPSEEAAPGGEEYQGGTGTEGGEEGAEEVPAGMEGEPPAVEV